MGLCPQVPFQLDQSAEAEQVWVWVLALDLAGEALEEADVEVLPGLPHRQLRLEVGLPVQVGRHDVAFARQGGGGEDQQVAGEGLLVLHGHDVAHLQPLALHPHQSALPEVSRSERLNIPLPPSLSFSPDNSHISIVDCSVVHVTEEILVTLVVGCWWIMTYKYLKIFHRKLQKIFLTNLSNKLIRLPNLSTNFVYFFLFLPASP